MTALGGLAGSQRIGHCLLTGDWGPLAKSHLIPKAFMQPADKQAPFLESDGRSRPLTRHTAWYDRSILGHRGEKLIAGYDDPAAKCFFEGGYTYRARRHPADITKLRDGPLPGGAIEIEGVDAAKVRLFALSLLWRAAVSQLAPMAAVKMRDGNLEDIRRRIETGRPGNPLEYAVYFCVFDSGEELLKIAPFQPSGHPFYRFFLDGVVAYVSPRRTLIKARKLGRLVVGTEPDRFTMLCLPSASSEHARITRMAAGDLFDEYGDIFAGFSGTRPAGY